MNNATSYAQSSVERGVMCTDVLEPGFRGAFSSYSSE